MLLRRSSGTQPIPVLLDSKGQQVRLNEKSEAPGLSIDHLRLGFYKANTIKFHSPGEFHFLDFADYAVGFVFVNINVILGFIFGALKTACRCRYMQFLQKRMNFDYDEILAANILESMRAVNVTKVVNDIASFRWENIPIVSQKGFQIQEKCNG